MATGFSSPRSFPEAEVAHAAGARPLRWRALGTRGYGRNTCRWLVQLGGGRTAFVKQALDETAREWLRREHAVYASVRAPYLPEFLGWWDGAETFLVLEDLTDCHWPPPWSTREIASARAALDAVHATPPPEGLPSLEDGRARLDGWVDVAADPEPLLSTHLCSREWLEGALPFLRDASAACELAGDELLHLDFRSDNLCFCDGRLRLVDWNHACVGNGLLDVVAWLPSLRLEGGPEPWEVVADSGGLAALIAGFFASRAGLPPHPSAPTVREFQRRQAAVALPWAARELGLPAPA